MNTLLVAAITYSLTAYFIDNTPRAVVIRASKQTLTRQAVQKTEQQELQQAWTLFAKAVQRNDLPAVRSLSAGCILMEPGQPTPYVTTAAFLRQQWPIVFNANTKARLLKPNCLRFNLDNAQNKHLYQQPCIANSIDFKTAKIQEVLVTVIDPYPASPGEGMQKAFAFSKTKNGFKFCGYGTIP
jgi:hypothetical protein